VKVLLFSNDTMPFGSLPTSGGGLRCWQLYQGLRSQGIEVIASMPAFTFLTKKYFNEIPQEVKENLWEWHTQDDIYARVKPDAVIFASNWDHYNLSKKPDVPLIIDLHGSRLIETSLWGEQPDINKKLEVFGKADCLLTAGQKQRSYFYGWFLQAGRIPEDEHFIRYIPISLAPEKFIRFDTPNTEYPYFVSGGGWFPWQDQSTAIFEICNSIVERKRGLIKIFGTPHESVNPSKDELKIQNIFKEVKAFSEKSSNVRVEGYVGRDELLVEYSRASVAVELMKYNLERELAFTTRTIEYLWCGLPVIYNHYSEISSHIKEYDAGWTIDPEDLTQLRDCLFEVFQNPEIVKIKSMNAQKLVEDRFSWDKTIAPCVEFLRNPKISKISKRAIIFNANRASYLAPLGLESSIKITNDQTLEQDFVFPAEGIWAVQLKIQEITKSANAKIQIIIKNSLGLKIAFLSTKISDLNSQEIVFLPLSRVLRPSGGSIGKILIKLENASENETLEIKTLAQKTYPLNELIVRSKENNILNSPMCLKIEFTPGVGRLYQLKVKFTKMLWIIRQGDYKRILRAVLKRVPALKVLLKPVL
jgi:glycosyltransferase involved in cell wall biosynthesis